MSRIEFPWFSLEVPPGWHDVTDCVEEEDPPVTLGREEGVGAIQISIALYDEGELSDPTPEDLLELLRVMAEAQALGEPTDVASASGPLRLAAASFLKREEGEFLRVWHLSDGTNFTLASYLCELGMQDQELAECEGIVRSLVFRAGEGSM